MHPARKPSTCAPLLAAACAAWLLLSTPLAVAAPIRWPSDNFVELLRNKQARDFLREFGARYGITVNVSGEVECPLNGRFNMLPQTMLDYVTTTCGLAWFYDGNVLYVSPAGESRSEVVRLANSSTDRLRESLTRLNLIERRFPITFDARTSTALISGPKAYVDLVRQAARQLDTGGSASEDGAQVRVFPLKYAWAADVAYTQAGRSTSVPGMASVLRSLYDKPRAAAQSAPTTSPMSRTVSRLRSLGLGNDPAAGDAQRMGPMPEEQPGVETAGRGLPHFEADGRMNAVIVRDLRERMFEHEATIKALDIKPGLVEIEARIIEVSSDAIDALGIDWRLRTGRVDLQFGRGNLPQLNFNNVIGDGAPLTIGPGGQNGSGGSTIPQPGVVPPVPLSDTPRGAFFSTRLGDAGRFLLARVNLLTQQGKANVLATPRVMTLDNVEAVLENMSTFFVRVAGNLEVQLFNVSSGTSLHVLPLIVTEGDQRVIKLAVRIEDGSISGQVVDQIPVVQRTTIGAQTLLRDGESLLIAGYAQESDGDTMVGVPGLSAIPVLGNLFKYSEKRKTRVERMFLLTPRVVDM